MHLYALDIVEIFLGTILIWVGLYILSQSIFNRLSFLIFIVLVGYGFALFSTSIILNTRNIDEYTLWQKINDWPFFIVPVVYYHVSLIVANKWTRLSKIFILFCYLVILILYVFDIKSGLIVSESILKVQNIKRLDIFTPGLLFVPLIALASICISLATKNYFEKIKNTKAFVLPMAASLVYLITGLYIGLGFYHNFSYYRIITSLLLAGATFLFAYFIILHNYAGGLGVDVISFGKRFLYKTALLYITFLIYIAIFIASGTELNFPLFVFLMFVFIVTMAMYSFYDWVSTFINDVVYNVSSGLSLVTDEEVYSTLKNYNKGERLEDSSLLRLNIVNHKVHGGMLPVDALLSQIEACLEYFKPIKDESKRTKANLKYHLLKMLTYEDAEEGQILWELGFEDYPVAIMTRENRARGPIFKVAAPSDYYFTSRNAYLALKKEAIHDIAWRLSYLEKSQKSRKFL